MPPICGAEEGETSRGREIHLEDVAKIKELSVSVSAHIDVAFALALHQWEWNSDERRLCLVESFGSQENLEQVLSMDQTLRLEVLHHLRDELDGHSPVLGEARTGVAFFNDHLLDVDLL
jgi:hypothetical protein